MILYHGTNISAALNILNEGFNFNYSGKNWGNTYGKGIYFTSNHETAKCYAGENGIILKFDLDISDSTILTKSYSPCKRFKLKTHTKWLITPDHDEYIMLN